MQDVQIEIGLPKRIQGTTLSESVFICNRNSWNDYSHKAYKAVFIAKLEYF